MATYSGRVIVLTGASQGIGKALALALAPQKPRLVLAARDETALQAVATQCVSLGAETFVYKTDVTDELQCRDLIRRTVKDAGALDVLIHNAGAGMNARFDELSDITIFEKLMRLNYLGPVYLTHEALPHLKASRGQIVVIASVAGLTGVPLRTAYSGSKHAVFGLFESMRIELEEFGISVTMIAPDFV
ncbi:MAG: SDR family oxidoreductase, partial [Vicinamibacteria bacterium]